ncbi:MAG TPA: hypothetical protein PLN56_10375 [Methanoregulaceae archaeon]|jgi:hypothetical protein|nr:hypothetical protein [Methanoregulaceae archaeon]
MPPKCTVCRHPQHNEIDKALVDGTASIRHVAAQYAVSYYAVLRHIKGGHIEARIERAARLQEKVEAEDFLTYIQHKRNRFDQMAKEAQVDGDSHLELKIYQTAAKFLELEGKALGAFREKLEHTGPGGSPIRIEVVRVANCNPAEN